jgi:hypothetical protein
MTVFAAPQLPLVSPSDLGSYIESVIGADVDLSVVLPGKDDVGGIENDELVIKGYESLYSEDMDILMSDNDGTVGNPSASLVTPVYGIGSTKRMRSQTPQDNTHLFTAKTMKTVDLPYPSSRPSNGRKSWSTQEDEFIMAYYEKHGAKWREMTRTFAAETLSARSEDALRNRHYRLTAHRDESSSTTSSVYSSSTSVASEHRQERLGWTVAEDELVLKIVSKSEERWSWQQVANLLPGRTAHAVRNRANRLFLERERTHIVNALPLGESSESSESGESKKSMKSRESRESR